MPVYVDVAPTIPLPSTKDIFTYQADGSITSGTIVTVPFGARSVRGVVIALHRKKPPYRTKTIQRIFPATLTANQLALGAQLTRLVGGGLGFALRLFFPPTLTESFTDRTSPQDVPATPQIAIGPLAARHKVITKEAQNRIDSGKQVLILVPERWMTERWPKALPYHGGLSKEYRLSVWKKVAAGDPVVIVGTQKSLFLPWQTLGLVVLEEEQLPTHKLWDGYPRGDNHWLVPLLTRISGADGIVSGSFPSLATYYHKKKWPKLLYKTTAPSFTMMPFTMPDRRDRRLLPESLVTQLRTWKRAGDTIFILHNEKESRVAAALRSLRLLKRNQVIIGTLALFAQLHDEKFDHVVWMFPERALGIPDTRANERTYILLARLGQMRRSAKQPIVLVSRNPSLIERTIRGSIAATYDHLLLERKKYLYPPYSDMIRLTFAGKSVKAAQERAVAARTLLQKQIIAERDTTRILGPYGDKEKYLLLLGNLSSLVEAYQSIYIDAIDIAPEKIV